MVHIEKTSISRIQYEEEEKKKISKKFLLRIVNDSDEMLH